MSNEEINYYKAIRTLAAISKSPDTLYWKYDMQEVLKHVDDVRALLAYVDNFLPASTARFKIKKTSTGCLPFHNSNKSGSLSEKISILTKQGFLK